ncbi:MAG TPA: DUF2062 domain-containing protein [Labilithrix sp.]
MFSRLWTRIKALWKLAKEERATPREIFWAVFLGAFAGSTPAVGFHGWVAVGLATLFRKNRLFAWLGSRVSNMVFLPFIIMSEIELARFARTGAFVTLERATILDEAPRLLLDWCLGTIPVGIAIGLLTALPAYAFAQRRDRRRLTRPMPAEPPAPSSGSPA